MKVVLINPAIEMNSRLWYPIGIGYLASVLLQNNYEVEIIDIIGSNLSRKDFESKIKESDAKYFGIGGILTAFNNVIDTASIIRKHHPDSKIFAGNTVGYTIPEILLKNSEIEIIVFGEGEKTILDLLKAFINNEDLNHVEGLAFKDSNNTIKYTKPRPVIDDLDSLPYPAWELLPV